VDLSGIATYADAEELFRDPAVQIVDICTPTPQHAPLTIAALKAGKHVVLEKPMALTLDECDAVIAASRETGAQLMVGHCLRYWPHYVKAREVIASGEFGRPLYAQLVRAGGIPRWSAGGWLTSAGQSGGVLDMHIHDIDVALWWFGEPASIRATGVLTNGLPVIMDATWEYSGGPLVNFHSAWDPNGGTFRHAFRLVLENATLAYDLATAPNVLEIFRDGAREEWPMPETSAHQAELDDFAQAIGSGIAFNRFTPEESRLAVQLGLQELQQIGWRPA
jgi:predicted dehydrogenase